jgi:hypothetical protein
MARTPSQSYGKALHQHLLRRLNQEPVRDVRFPADRFQKTLADWQARASFVDRNQCLEAGRSCFREPKDCVGRCYLGYWLEHQVMAAEAMSYIATLVGDDDHIELYHQTGRLHDIDYLSHPHDTGNPHDSCHPVPLVEYLEQESFPIPGCIAILEHAPYLGLGRHGDDFTRRLSLALSICEDAVTLRATELYQNESKCLPEDMRNMLSIVSKPNHLIDIAIDRGRYSGLPTRITENHAALMALRLNEPAS